MEDLSALMRAANGGNAGAYRQLLDALAPMLRAVARRGLSRFNRGPEEAEDVVQEALLAIHLKRHTWDDAQPLEPWVRAIAHHKLVDMLRRRGFTEHVPIEICDTLDQLSLAPTQLDGVECADLLALLPERDRAIVQGMAIEGRSAREVGLQLGLAEGAVRVALHRALKMMAAAGRRDRP
ncbi:MAG: sigma-70 family RNA polymerase sigma factor [Hyphomicrobiaceae bacterium]